MLLLASPCVDLVANIGPADLRRLAFSSTLSRFKSLMARLFRGDVFSPGVSSSLPDREWPPEERFALGFPGAPYIPEFLTLLQRLRFQKLPSRSSLLSESDALMRLKLGVGGVVTMTLSDSRSLAGLSGRFDRVLPAGLAGFWFRLTGLGAYGSFLASDARFAAEVLTGERLFLIGEIERSLRVGVPFALPLAPSISWRQLLILSEACCTLTGFGAKLRDPRLE